jgi:hypothetical protein
MLVALAFLALAWLTAPAYSQAAVVHVSPGSCGVIDGAGVIVLISGLVQAVESDSGNVTLHCAGTLPSFATVPATATHYDGNTTPILCATPFGATNDWKETVTPSGRVSLQCKIKP